MKSFKRTTLDLPPVKQFITDTVKEYNCTRAEAKRQYNRLKLDEIYVNDLYQVNIDRNPENKIHPQMVHLSCKRRDKETLHDWRELQEIKNMLCGEECEALELYPAESRAVDTANQYHLWVLPPGMHIPVGWSKGAKDGESPKGGKQRPFEGDES